MTDVERFLKQAVAVAVDNVRARRGRPFGAVLVKDGEVLATGGVNEVAATIDPTAHAERQAIRAACRRTGDVRLDGCVMFASGHPCPMCLTAMYLTGIRHVYCGVFAPRPAAGGIAGQHPQVRGRRLPPATPPPRPCPWGACADTITAARPRTRAGLGAPSERSETTGAPTAVDRTRNQSPY